MILYCILIGFGFLGINWLVRILRTNHKLNLLRKNNDENVDFPIYVLIPVLDEHNRIKKTVDYFHKHFSHLDQLKLVLITTEKEFDYNKEGKTLITSSLLKKKYTDFLSIIHYPKRKGNMAHQLNYAITKLRNKNAWFAIYNADSRPDKKTFTWIGNIIKKIPNINVFQQYGDYSENISPFKGIKNLILVPAASWQNRWSIGFELNHNFNQFSNFFTFKKQVMNYCIGHGLIFKDKVYDKVGGFSEDMHNEDAIFGLKLSYLKERIVPLPFYDLSDSPDSIYGLYTQKANWFFGPLQSFKYYCNIIKEKNWNKYTLFKLCFSLFTHAIWWVIGPTLFFISIILLIFNFSTIAILFWLMVYLIFLPIPNILSHYLVSKKLNLKIIFCNLFGAGFVYLLHGLSAYRTLFLILLSRLFNYNIKKGKTDMKK
jgi:hypothetical protein